MGRFTNWTEQSLKKIKVGYVNDKGTKLNSSIKELSKPNYEEQILNALQKNNIFSQKEYRFLEDRRFRFDVAVPYYRIAIEFEGGVWTRGRHNRSLGFLSDVKKYNLATMHGWRLLRYTIEDAKKKDWLQIVVDDVLNLIKRGKL